MSADPAASAAPVSADPATGCTVSVVELDFANKTERAVRVEDVKPATQAGHFVWIDVDVADIGAARTLIRGLGLVDDDVLEVVLGEGAPMQYARYERYLHLVVSGARARADDFALERISAVMGESFLITTHRGPTEVLTAVKRDYRNDFIRFAKSPSFMVYELIDHVLESFLATQNRFGERVERLQEELRTGQVDDTVFIRISEIGADLLHFRKVLLPMRALLSDLSTRRSLFLSEATQRFLGNMVGTVEHLIEDLLVDREILSQSLNLYMSFTSHRTNQVMKRLTVLSFFFLPLTFLVGVYGMNFRILPELEWRYGYLFFWSVTVLIVGLIAFIMRRTRML